MLHQANARPLGFDHSRREPPEENLFSPSIQSGADLDGLAVQGFWECTIVGVRSLLSQMMIGHAIGGFVVSLLFYLGGVGVRVHNPFAAAITCSCRIFAPPGSRPAGNQTPKKLPCRHGSRKRSSTNSRTHGRRGSGRRYECSIPSSVSRASLSWSPASSSSISGAGSNRRVARSCIHLPMQNVLKIKFRMSSVVVAPVMASSGRSAL
jgi:hypothetical protein